jgi:hypothetical protein
MTARLWLAALLLFCSPWSARPADGDPVRLPASLDVRYRVELAGEHVGWARLALTCRTSRCDALWESSLRAPEEAGGAVLTRRIDIEAERGGPGRRVRVRAVADGRERRIEAGPGAIPASLAEVILASAGEGERRCVGIRDEESGREGRACARRSGAWLEGDVLGEPIRFRCAVGEAPAEVLVPGQGIRFLQDPGASLPRRAPRLFGTAVAPPRAGRLCGVPRDGVPPPAPLELPSVFPAGASCRERTSHYLEIAAKAGLRGSHAVGVAFDGHAYVWHEWAELLVRGRWIAVDPSFEQAPAEGPRFTVARFEDRDAAGRDEAGRRVLECWSAGGRGPPPGEP